MSKSRKSNTQHGEVHLASRDFMDGVLERAIGQSPCKELKIEAEHEYDLHLLMPLHLRGLYWMDPISRAVSP